MSRTTVLPTIVCLILLFGCAAVLAAEDGPPWIAPPTQSDSLARLPSQDVQDTPIPVLETTTDAWQSSPRMFQHNAPSGGQLSSAHAGTGGAVSAGRGPSIIRRNLVLEEKIKEARRALDN